MYGILHSGNKFAQSIHQFLKSFVIYEFCGKYGSVVLVCSKVDIDVKLSFYNIENLFQRQG